MLKKLVLAAMASIAIAGYGCDNRVNNEPTRKQVDEEYLMVAECLRIENPFPYKKNLTLKYLKKHSHSNNYAYDLDHALIHYFLEMTKGNPGDDHKYPFSFRCEFEWNEENNNAKGDNSSSNNIKSNDVQKPIK